MIEMKKIEAYIKPERFEFVKKALEQEGYYGMSVSEIKGRGNQKGIAIPYRGGTIDVDLIPKLKLEIVIPDKDTDNVITTIKEHAKTGKIGDGRIFVYPVEQGIRIRTGEIEEESPSPQIPSAGSSSLIEEH